MNLIKALAALLLLPLLYLYAMRPWHDSRN